MVTRNIDDLEPILKDQRDKTAVWCLCHYPEHPETDERVAAAARISRQWQLPVWAFGSSSARYEKPVEEYFREKLINLGVDPTKIKCSSDFGTLESLDTVQEMFNIARTAEAKGIRQVICISNPLQLLQVHGLMRDQDIEWIYVPTALRDWRWWYVAARAVLIPVAFAGMGKKFIPLKLVREARAKWKACPF